MAHRISCGVFVQTTAGNRDSSFEVEGWCRYILPLTPTVPGAPSIIWHNLEGFLMCRSVVGGLCAKVLNGSH